MITSEDESDWIERVRSLRYSIEFPIPPGYLPSPIEDPEGSVFVVPMKHRKPIIFHRVSRGYDILWKPLLSKGPLTVTDTAMLLKGL